MKYFLHDTNAFQDEKITQLYMEYGYEGLGLFYTLLEKLALQEKPVKTEVLKKQLSVGKKLEKIWSFFEEIELIYSNNGETFNENILKFSQKYLIKKEKTKERVSEWRKNQEVTKEVTRYERVRNSDKDNISKDNISIVNTIHGEIDAEASVNVGNDSLMVKENEAIGFKGQVKDGKPKKEKHTHPAYQCCSEIFLNFYKDKHKTKYIFEGQKDGNNLKQLIGKLEVKCREEEMPDTVENLCNLFNLILNSINDQWILSHLSISLLNSKFNDIYKKPSAKKSGAYSAVSLFNQMLGNAIPS